MTFYTELINTYEMRVPVMLLQPIIENVIWHGISHLESVGKLTLDYQYDGVHLVISVTDNGVGRERAREINQNIRQDHISHGSQILDTRISMLNLMHKNSISITYEDLYEQGLACGTRVVVKILAEIYNSKI